jgi:hypothetical protein
VCAEWFHEHARGVFVSVAVYLLGRGSRKARIVSREEWLL